MTNPPPIRPLCGVSTCVIRGDRVLLAKRKKQPAQGLWSLPGGHVELGEVLQEAALRELEEETGVSARIERLLDYIDVIHRDPKGNVTAHYIINVFAATWLAGDGVAASDANAVRWVTTDELADLEMTPGIADLVRNVLGNLTKI